MAKIELHMHPFFEAYGLEAIVEAMEAKGLDVVALSGLNKDIFSAAQKMANMQKKYQRDGDDMALVIKKNGKERYLLRATEVVTKEGFHLLIIGDGQVAPYNETGGTIESALEHECLIIFAHPFVNMNSIRLKNLGFEGVLAVEHLCRRYSRNIAVEWNGYCKPWVRRLFGSKDANELTKRLFGNHNIPVVAATDVHAFNRGLLSAIGTAYIETEIQPDSGDAIVASLKDNISSGNYKSHEAYISFAHFIKAFAMPYLFEKCFKRAER